MDFSPETNTARAAQTDIFHSIKTVGGTETKIGTIDLEVIRVEPLTEAEGTARNSERHPLSSRPSFSSAFNCFNYISIYRSLREGCLLN